MNFRSFLTICILTLFISCTKSPSKEKNNNTISQTKPREDSRPNIIVILADDLGYNDLGFTGSKDIKTPAIDQLAENGIIFKNGYATHSYCTPARGALLVGRHQARFGLESNLAHTPFNPYYGISTKEILFPKRLQKVGYKTGMVGKWYLGSHDNFHPLNRGFDYFYGFLGGAHHYFPDKVSIGTNPYTTPMEENKKVGKFDEYLTSEFSNHAVKFIKENQENPYFLYVSYNAPHGPLEATQEYLDKFKHIEDKDRRTYLAMVSAMDDGIGSIVNTLKETGNYENTLIFFLSDHGGPYPEEWCPDLDYPNNYPFRRGKVALTEGGIHVPFIAHWPEKIKAGFTFDGLVSALDIAATSVAIANAKEDQILEGVNLEPYFTKEKTNSPHNALFWRLEEDDNLWAVRTVDYKYMHQPLPNVGLCFFDMKNDPYEKVNLAGKRLKEQKELADLWNHWNAENVNNSNPPYYKYKPIMKMKYKKLKDSLDNAAKDRGVYLVN